MLPWSECIKRYEKSQQRYWVKRIYVYHNECHEPLLKMTKHMTKSKLSLGVFSKKKLSLGVHSQNLHSAGSSVPFSPESDTSPFLFFSFLLTASPLGPFDMLGFVESRRWNHSTLASINRNQPVITYVESKVMISDSSVCHSLVLGLELWIDSFVYSLEV